MTLYLIYLGPGFNSRHLHHLHTTYTICILLILVGEYKMKLLFENWRKFVNEVDTDGDGIEDERELAIIDRGEVAPAAPGTTSLSKKAKNEIRSYLQAWFNDAAYIYGNDPGNSYKTQRLIRDLKKGVARQGHTPGSTRVDFNHMLNGLDPEDQEATANFLGSLAKKVEEYPGFIDNKNHRFEVIEQMLQGEDPGNREGDDVLTLNYGQEA